MAEFYSQSHRKLQGRFDTLRLADVLRGNIFRTELAEMDRRFIVASDFFFLSSLDQTSPKCTFTFLRQQN